MNWRQALSHRLVEGICIAAALIVVITASLAFAHTWAQIADGTRCFPTIWTSQFPKWLGCTMAAHENLAGGLIGGGGALFAAWYAGSVVREQILDDRRRAQEVRARQIREQMEQVGYEITTLLAYREACKDACRTYTAEVDAQPSVRWAKARAFGRTHALGKFAGVQAVAIPMDLAGITALNLLQSSRALGNDVLRNLDLYDTQAVGLYTNAAAALDRLDQTAVPDCIGSMKQMVDQLKSAMDRQNGKLATLGADFRR
jgi:hypothetical protein